VSPKTALRLAQIDETVCWKRFQYLLKAWLSVESPDPRYHTLYEEYCVAKTEWQASAAKLYRIGEAKGKRHLRRVA